MSARPCYPWSDPPAARGTAPQGSPLPGPPWWGTPPQQGSTGHDGVVLRGRVSRGNGDALWCLECQVDSASGACGDVWGVSPWKCLLVVVSVATVHTSVRCINMQWATPDSSRCPTGSWPTFPAHLLQLCKLCADRSRYSAASEQGGGRLKALRDRPDEPSGQYRGPTATHNGASERGNPGCDSHP